MTRLWVGVITFIAGSLLWFAVQSEYLRGPRWLLRLGAGIGFLGLSTLLTTQTGLTWSLASIALSIVAIWLIVSVIIDNLRRKP